MPIALYLAAFLLIAIGIAHSVLGERYILIRLFRRPDLPKLRGGTELTTRTLRFAWHLTSLAWWGFAAILIHLANGPVDVGSIFLITGVTFFTTGLVTLAVSRGQHFAWPVFLVVGGITLYAGLI